MTSEMDQLETWLKVKIAQLGEEWDKYKLNRPIRRILKTQIEGYELTLGQIGAIREGAKHD